MSTFKKNVLWSYFGFFLRAGLGFLLAPVMIKLIGLEGYGKYVLLSVYSYFGVLQLVDLGFPLVIQKISSTTSENENTLKDLEVLSFCNVASLSFLALVSIFGFYTLIKIDTTSDLGFLSLFNHSKNIWLIFIALVLLNIVQLLISNLSSLLSSKKLFNNAKKIEAIQGFCWVFFGFLTVFYYRLDFILYFLIGNIVTNLLLLAYSLKILRLNIISCVKHFSFESFYKYEIKPVWGSSFLLKLNGITFKQTDSFIVSIFLSPSGVALLDIATKFLSLFKTILGRLNEVVFVHYNLRSTKFSIDKLEVEFMKILFIQSLISTVFASVLIITPYWILKLWLHQNIALESINHLKISGLIMLTVPFAHLVPSYLIAVSKNMGDIARRIALVSIFNIGTSILLVKFFGVVGVMYSTLVQHILLAIVLISYSNFQKVNFHKLLSSLVPYYLLLTMFGLMLSFSSFIMSYYSIVLWMCFLLLMIVCVFIQSKRNVFSKSVFEKVLNSI